LIVATTDGGKTWDTQYETTWNDAGGSIACPASGVCFSSSLAYDSGAGSTTLRSVILATQDGGGNWDVQKRVRGTYLFEIACPSSEVCYAVGSKPPQPNKPAGAGIILRTDDGGKTWQSTE
jgi:hypothetical protein